MFQTATARVRWRPTVTASAALRAVCLAPAAVVGQKTVELRRFAGATFEASGVGGLFVVFDTSRYRVIR